MRIAIATGIYPPDIGGPAKHVRLFQDFLAGQQSRASVITYGSQKLPFVWSVSRQWPFGIRQLIYFLKCLAAALFNDVFYAQDVTSAGLPALVAAKILRRKFVVRIGGDVLWERLAETGKTDLSVINYYAKKRYYLDAPILYPVTLLVLRWADAVIVPAELLRKLYIDYYGADPRKIVTVPNPVIISAEQKCPNTDPAAFLFAGRFVRYKNLDMLMRVFDRVRRKKGSGKLVLIGDGPERPGLENLKTQLDSKDFIEIQKKTSSEELAKIISCSGVCIGPASTEFNPNFILECLSAGRPVILSRENGLSIPLGEEFIFDPKNEQELEQKMENLLNSAKYRRLQSAVKKISKVDNKTFEIVLDIFRGLHL